MSTQEKTYADLYNEVRTMDPASAVIHIAAECNNLRGKTRARRLLIEFGIPGPDVIAMGENYEQVANSIMNHIATGKVPNLPGNALAHQANQPAPSPAGPPVPTTASAPQPPAQVPHGERLRLIQHVRSLEDHFATNKKPEEWWHSASVDTLNQYKAALESSAGQAAPAPSPGEPVSEIALSPTPQPPDHQPIEPTLSSTGVETALPAIPGDWGVAAQAVESTRLLEVSPTGYTVPQNIIDSNPEGAIKLWYASFMNRAQINKAISTPHMRLLCGRNGLKLDGCNSKSKKAALMDNLLVHLWPNGHVEYYPEGLAQQTMEFEPPPPVESAYVPPPQPTHTTPTPTTTSSIATDPLAPTTQPPTSPSPTEIALDNVSGAAFLPMLQQVLNMQQDLWDRQQLILNNLDVLAATQASMDTVVAEMSRGIIRLNNLPTEPINCQTVLTAMGYSQPPPST